MLEVEDWTQPNQARGRKGTTARRASSETAVAASPNDNTVILTPPPAAAETIPFEPPEAEVEESFRVGTRPRSVHAAVIPGSGSNTRVASSPPARPSSLSRLLAQAATETIDSADEVDQLDSASTSLRAAAATATITATPASDASDPQPTSPSLAPEPSPSSPSISPKKLSAPGSGRIPYQNLPSPLRPGSRASRISFSGGRLPPLVSHASNSALSKAAATTALSDMPLSSSPTGLITEGSSGSDGTKTVTDSSESPSPTQSISEAMSANVHWIRQRTASTNSPLNPSISKSTGGTTPISTFSPFSNWGFGKKKKSTAETAQPVKADLTHTAPSSSSTRTSLDRPADVATAADLLKQFER
jgi:autophagy-related protein 11